MTIEIVPLQSALASVAVAYCYNTMKVKKAHGHEDYHDDHHNDYHSDHNDDHHNDYRDKATIPTTVGVTIGTLRH